MCEGPKSETSSCDLEMESGFRVETGEISLKFCTKLLELAAIDDFAGFRQEIEMGSDLDEVGVWYGRSFGSNKMGFEERTPLMIAALYGSTSVLRYIVDSGKVDVNRACGSDGATALHCAAAGGSGSCLEVVKILIGAYADVNALDVKGKRAGDLVAACLKYSNSSKRRALEMVLNGFVAEMAGEVEEEERKTPKAVKEGMEKKEYPFDVSLPDINNGIYGTDEFRMYSFKVKPCSRAYSHDWTECPFVHPGENARRRDLRKFHYSCVPCPEFKKGSCAKGDNCEYAHGVFESWLHPAQYRTRLCKDETGCSRKVCFFAHKPEELRPLYAATGSAMPSPKSASAASLDMSPLCSSPMGGTTHWQSAMGMTPPALQLPGSRLKATFSSRDLDLDLEIRELEKIRTQQRQQLVEEMAGLSSPYSRISGGDLNPTNLEDVFGSYDPSLLSKMQGLSPKFNGNNAAHQIQSPTARQTMNQLRASYPANLSSSPSRKYGFDSSAAVAAAVLNSRSSSFAKRSQSFVDRGRSPFSPGLVPSKLSEWSSPDGKLDWGFSGDDASKLRKSASFGIRGKNGITAGGSTLTPIPLPDEPDVSWVNSLVKDKDASGDGRPGETVVPHWLEQMYIDQEQIVA